MPWKIKKRGDKFCVYKPDTGEIITCKHKTKGEAEAHRMALYANAGHKLETNMITTVSMRRPVMLGVALTNRPHVRLKGHPIEVVEKDGKEVLRVPFMISGKYHHPHGDLDITDEILDRFLENFQAGVADNELGLDARHKPELGSIAWFEQNLGGKVVKENLPDGGKMLVGYGVPTGPDSVELVKQGKFRYASLEFHPNYRSNVKQRYLSDDLTDSNEVILLFNPFHSKSDGRFSSKSGGSSSGPSKESEKKETGTGTAFTRKGSVSYGIKEGVRAMFKVNGLSKFEKIQGGTKSQRRQRQVGRAIGVLGTAAALAWATGAVLNTVS